MAWIDYRAADGAGLTWERRHDGAAFHLEAESEDYRYHIMGRSADGTVHVFRGQGGKMGIPYYNARLELIVTAIAEDGTPGATWRCRYSSLATALAATARHVAGRPSLGEAHEWQTRIQTAAGQSQWLMYQDAARAASRSIEDRTLPHDGRYAILATYADGSQLGLVYPDGDADTVAPALPDGGEIHSLDGANYGYSYPDDGGWRLLTYAPNGAGYDVYESYLFLTRAELDADVQALRDFEPDRYDVDAMPDDGAPSLTWRSHKLQEWHDAADGRRYTIVPTAEFLPTVCGGQITIYPQPTVIYNFGGGRDRPEDYLVEPGGRVTYQDGESFHQGGPWTVVGDFDSLDAARAAAQATAEELIVQSLEGGWWDPEFPGYSFTEEPCYTCGELFAGETTICPGCAAGC